MAVDVTAWTVVGKQFNDKRELVEYLEQRNFDVDNDIEEQDFYGFDALMENAYHSESSYILGKRIYGNSNVEFAIGAIADAADRFENAFGEQAEFIVTEHWW